MHTVDHLYIYPIKGFSPHEVVSAYAGDIGFNGDRRFMLVDDDNTFVTARTLHQLLQCKSEINDAQITIDVQNNRQTFDIKDNGPSMVARIWDDYTRVQIVNEDINTWLSERFDKRVNLVKMADDSARVHESKNIDITLNVTLADAYPFQILGTESINHLAKLLQHTVNPLRFRPNIIVSTTKAHEEDQWKILRIGEVVLERVKTCVRCNIINIDPLSGASDSAISKTLAGYRNFNKGIEFGVYFKVKQKGTIRQNDEVEVMDVG
ncbi:MAG: MOSC domain-containing protein [Saprospiraceae bacterium]